MHKTAIMLNAKELRFFITQLDEHTAYMLNIGACGGGLTPDEAKELKLTLNLKERFLSSYNMAGEKDQTQ